jgi:hypothetical protein
MSLLYQIKAFKLFLFVSGLIELVCHHLTLLLQKRNILFVRTDLLCCVLQTFSYEFSMRKRFTFVNKQASYMVTGTILHSHSSGHEEYIPSGK